MRLASSLPLSNFLQPLQAQTPMTIRTPTPADGILTDGPPATITFDVKGTVVNPLRLDITNGTFQVTSKQDGKILQSGSISSVSSCCLTNLTGGEEFSLGSGTGDPSNPLIITTRCSTLATNSIFVFYLAGASPYYLDFIYIQIKLAF